MTLVRARIIPARDAAGASSARPELPVLTPAHHRRIAADEVRARDAAAEVLAAAHREADAMLAAARLAAQKVGEDAGAEAREAVEAKAAALFLRLKQEDERRAERDLDRAVALAVVLSERLLGAALEQDPHYIVSLARQALAEARGARRATIDASPLDAEALQRHLVDAGFDSHAVEIHLDPSMSRGSLRITTNLGALDARLRPQLERLARALRETLERP